MELKNLFKFGRGDRGSRRGDSISRQDSQGKPPERYSDLFIHSEKSSNDTSVGLQTDRSRPEERRHLDDISQDLVENGFLTAANSREKYVFNRLNELVPNHGGDSKTTKYGDQTNPIGPPDSPRTSKPDVETPKSIIEISGDDTKSGKVPDKYQYTEDGTPRGIRQLRNYARYGGERQVYLLYEGDTSKFQPRVQQELKELNVIVIEFRR